MATWILHHGPAETANMALCFLRRHLENKNVPSAGYEWQLPLHLQCRRDELLEEDHPGFPRHKVCRASRCQNHACSVVVCIVFCYVFCAHFAFTNTICNWASTAVWPARGQDLGVLEGIHYFVKIESPPYCSMLGANNPNIPKQTRKNIQVNLKERIGYGSTWSFDMVHFLVGVCRYLSLSNPLPLELPVLKA